MTDSKNIVIKVKYTTPGAEAEASASASRMVTEWNIKRIAGAVGVLMLLLISLSFLFISGKSDQADTARTETVPNKTPVLQPSSREKEPLPLPPAPASPSDSAQEPAAPSPSQSAPSAKTGHSGRIRRAALAYRITDKEPAELVGTTVSIGGGNPIEVYYFTEVRGKAAQTLFHEWLKNGQTLMRQPMVIAAERWRTSSHRRLGPEDLGNWSVRAVDDKGNVMNEIHFSVSVK
jgi:type IV secretory pathway VirB10-like protein